MLISVVLILMTSSLGVFSCPGVCGANTAAERHRITSQINLFSIVPKTSIFDAFEARKISKNIFTLYYKVLDIRYYLMYRCNTMNKTSAVRGGETGGDEPVNLGDRAIDNLKYIRETME